MKIARDSVVAIHYTLTNDDGETLDSSAGSDPLNYLHGHGGLIGGLEKELEGRSAGDSFKASIAPADGYGEHHPEMIQEVPLEALAQIENLTVGMQIQSQAPDGQVQVLIVEAIGEDTATLNANHPLAGQTLHFDVTVTDIRAATEEELAHGHAH
jgi:FKBP-type peptidyl-prolyl cis-trans isomerase SlyD